ncbi:GH43 family beta-xylosidase [Kribbella aluminosa]|uniref:GH43 family beta-xylosidase n=1 Tax=Kribbella aluminosa TaxID=416017 RepID=A0ABS4UFV3_9ACTN|nr:family 43 glycosylhydrolase [Kribbella aluminosa]MBP2350441.1 GH43 family beta-xylosidase [Kribbella aluminosa]
MAKFATAAFGVVTLVVSAFLPITGDHIADRTTANRAAVTDVQLPARPNAARNPVRENAADPWMVFAEGNYNLLYTRGDKLVGVASPSVDGLAAAPEQTLWQPPAGEACCNLWAPEIHQLDGKWYLYYTADNGTDSQHRMFVLEADHPMGPYGFKAKLDTGNEHSIDGSILNLPDGRLYHLWSSGRPDGQDLYIAPMSNPWTISGPPALLARPDQPWEQNGRKVTEAPNALVHNGKAYVYYSGSACESPDYALGVLELTGTDPLDQSAWTKSGPVFKRNDANWVFGTGHNGFFTSPDGKETWIVYHAVTSSSGTPAGSCNAGRAVRIGKVTYDAAGKPQLGTPSAAWQSFTLPSGDPGGDIVADGIYEISPRNAPTNRLEVDACSAADAATVQVYTRIAASRCQKWRLSYLGDGSYKFLNNDSGKALDVGGCSGANGVKVIQWPYWGGDCQEWYLDAIGNGYYKVTSKVGGRTLDVGGCSTAPGADVDVWPYWQGDCQQWKLEKVG